MCVFLNQKESTCSAQGSGKKCWPPAGLHSLCLASYQGRHRLDSWVQLAPPCRLVASDTPADVQGILHPTHHTWFTVSRTRKLTILIRGYGMKSQQKLQLSFQWSSCGSSQGILYHSICKEHRAWGQSALTCSTQENLAAGFPN